MRSVPPSRCWRILTPCTQLEISCCGQTGRNSSLSRLSWATSSWARGWAGCRPDSSLSLPIISVAVSAQDSSYRARAAGGGEQPGVAVALAGGEAAEAGVVEEAGRVVGPGDVGERPAQDHGRETEQVEHVPQRPLVPGGGRAGRGHVDGLGQSVQVRPLLGGQPQGPGQAV